LVFVQKTKADIWEHTATAWSAGHVTCSLLPQYINQYGLKMRQEMGIDNLSWKRTQLPLLLANPEGAVWQGTWQHLVGAVSQGRYEACSLTLPSIAQTIAQQCAFLEQDTTSTTSFSTSQGKEISYVFQDASDFSDFDIRWGLVDSSHQRKRLWHWKDQLFDTIHKAGNEQDAMTDLILWAHWRVRTGKKFMFCCRYSHKFCTHIWKSFWFKF